MTTDLKRVYFYVPSEDKQTIQKVADDLGCSTSRLCADVMRNALPNLRVVAEAMRVARTDPQKAAQMMNQLAETAQGDLLDAVEGLNNDVS